MIVGYFPLMQISRPGDRRGVPRNRWVYKHKAHAMSVLQEIIERRPSTVPFMVPLNGQGPIESPISDERSRPWLLVVKIPKGTPLAEVMKKHKFGPQPGQNFDEFFPAYYLRKRGVVQETIELQRDDEWIAVQVQRAMQKA